jgi:hypothetical protein
MIPNISFALTFWCGLTLEAVCQKTLQGVNRDLGQNPRPKISVKNYMSYGITFGCTHTALTSQWGRWLNRH